jgi:hypothetical protein
VRARGETVTVAALIASLAFAWIAKDGVVKVEHSGMMSLSGGAAWQPAIRVEYFYQ